MDAAPRSFAELPRDPTLGVPVPFACGTDQYAARSDSAATESAATESAPSARELDKRRVTQCALSRICGVCGAGLGRPIAFLGTTAEVDRLAFHFPPTHQACAEALLAAYAGVTEPVLGQDPTPEEWVLVTTSSFEFVRANREDLDRRPTFQPHNPVPVVERPVVEHPVVERPVVEQRATASVVETR
jgi:hypothetical protein